MRRSIQRLISLGPLPTEKNAKVEVIKEYESLIQSIETPLTIEEANKLVTLFGSDSCFGLAWTLLHMIEATPEWFAKDQLTENGNDWVQLLIKRAKPQRQ